MSSVNPLRNSASYFADQTRAEFLISLDIDNRTNNALRRALYIAKHLVPNPELSQGVTNNLVSSNANSCEKSEQEPTSRRDMTRVAKVTGEAIGSTLAILALKKMKPGLDLRPVILTAVAWSLRSIFGLSM